MKFDTLKFLRDADPTQFVSVLLLVAANNPDVLEAALAKMDDTRGESYNLGAIVVVATGAQISELRILAAKGGQKVPVIKRIREIWNIGLKEAKDFAELLGKQGKINADCAKVDLTAIESVPR